MKRNLKWHTCILLLAAATLSAAPKLSQDAPQQGQEQSQKEQKKKKKGGFFKGLKAVTGQGSEQQEATATAGSKSVGEGEKIGNVAPSAADREQLHAMETYSVPEEDLKRFQKDGHLEPKQQ